MSRSPSEPPADQPPRRERNAVETKRRLLDAAEAEFASKGYAGARLREVAQNAGVQQALIHHYFEDKDGLYRAVLERALEQTTADSWAILGQVADIEDLLTSYVDLLVRFHVAHANLLAMLRMEALSGSQVVVEVVQQRTRPLFEAAEKLIERFQKEGKVRGDIPASEMIIAVLALSFYPLQEAALLEALWPSRGASQDALKQRKEAIVSLLLKGVLWRAAPG